MRREHIRLARIALLACALLACEQKQEKKPLPDWSGHYDQGDSGVVDASKGAPVGGFSMVIPDDVEYPYRLYEEGREDAPCAIDLGDQSHKDIRCILDMNELDLFVQGFKFDVVTPEGGCDYVLYDPYLYESWEIGQGPTEVSYTVNEDGTFSDEVNSQGGTPACNFDYSHEAALGPNCCYGQYTLTIKSAMTGETTTEANVWGGPSPDCYDGAAFLRDGVKLDAYGFPLAPIYPVDREHHVIPIVQQGLSDKYPKINVPLANYWNPEDGTAPKGLRDMNARPDYTLTCLDHADEVLGRIRFQVREWNEEVQFDTHGNPDTLGVERDFDSPPINDELDWKDLMDQMIDFPRTLRPKSTP